MGGKSRGITLMILVLIVMTAVTVDQYIQARARLPRGPLRQESPAPSTSTRDADVLAVRGPDVGTRWSVRIGGVRIPSIPEDATPIRPPVDTPRGTTSGGALGATRGTGDPTAESRRSPESGGRELATEPPRQNDDRRHQPATPSPSEKRPFAYTVQPNETLSDLAARFLGDENAWGRIADLNGITDATKLRAGQKIRIPAR